MAQLELSEYLNQIGQWLDKGQAPLAAAHCLHLLQTHPRHIPTYQLLGRALFVQRAYPAAQDLFLRVLSADPFDALAHYGLAIIYRTSNKAAEALWHAEKAYEIEPHTPVYRKLLTDLIQGPGEEIKLPLSKISLIRFRLQTGLYRLAVEEAQKLHQAHPNRADILLLLAEAYWWNLQRVEASKTAEKVLHQLPFCIRANAILAETWLRTGRMGDALQPMQLIQDMLLPSRRHKNLDTPEGRAFAEQTNLQLPREIILEVPEQLDVKQAQEKYEANWEENFEGEGAEEVGEGADFYSFLESNADDWMSQNMTLSGVRPADLGLPNFSKTSETPSESNEWLEDLYTSSGTTASQPAEEDLFTASSSDWEPLEEVDLSEMPTGAEGSAAMPEWLSDMGSGMGLGLSQEDSGLGDSPDWLTDSAVITPPPTAKSTPAAKTTPPAKPAADDLSFDSLWGEEEEPVSAPAADGEDFFSSLSSFDFGGDEEESAPAVVNTTTNNDDFDFLEELEKPAGKPTPPQADQSLPDWMSSPAEDDVKASTSLLNFFDDAGSSSSGYTHVFEEGAVQEEAPDWLSGGNNPFDDSQKPSWMSDREESPAEAEEPMNFSGLFGHDAGFEEEEPANNASGGTGFTELLGDSPTAGKGGTGGLEFDNLFQQGVSSPGIRSSGFTDLLSSSPSDSAFEEEDEAPLSTSPSGGTGFTDLLSESPSGREQAFTDTGSGSDWWAAEPDAAEVDEPDAAEPSGFTAFLDNSNVAPSPAAPSKPTSESSSGFTSILSDAGLINPQKPAASQKPTQAKEPSGFTDFLSSEGLLSEDSSSTAPTAGKKEPAGGGFTKLLSGLDIEPVAADESDPAAGGDEFPDWLSEPSSMFQTQAGQNEDELPDWLKDDGASPTSKDKSAQSKNQPAADDDFDWLK